MCEKVKEKERMGGTGDVQKEEIACISRKRHSIWNEASVTNCRVKG